MWGGLGEGGAQAEGAAPGARPGPQVIVDPHPAAERVAPESSPHGGVEPTVTSMHGVCGFQEEGQS